MCTSSQYQSYPNNWASWVATNVSICVDLPIGRTLREAGGTGGEGGASGGGARGPAATENR